jgi:hypothetical protein
MQSLLDYSTQDGGAGALVTLLIVVLLVVVGLLRPEPLGSMIDMADEDLRQIKAGRGRREETRTVRDAVSASLNSLAYIVSLPIVFMFAVNLVLVESVGRAINVAAEWMAMMIFVNTHQLARVITTSVTRSRMR